MSVRVTLERSVIPGSQGEVTRLLRELLSKAVQYPGFQSGETVLGLFNPTSFLTITRWSNLSAWQAWEKEPERRRIVQRINALLQNEPVIRLWNEDADAPPPGA